MKTRQLVALATVLVLSVGAALATCYVEQFTTSGGVRRCACAKMTWGSTSCYVVSGGSDCILSADRCSGGEKMNKIKMETAALRLLFRGVSVFLRDPETVDTCDARSVKWASVVPS